MTYEVHPHAELIPPMSAEEFAELRKDIGADGYRQDEPLVLYEGKILDGRHRDRACRELGIAPPTRNFDGDDPVAYVISKNVHRRHLNPGQKAMTAAGALPHLEEEARKRMAVAGSKSAPGKPVPSGTPLPADSKRAAAEAAELTGASARSVARAKRVKDADPDLAEQVKSGEISLTKAEAKVGGKSEKKSDTGLATKTDALGRKQPTVRYGKGDKWQESTEPLARYLVAQEKRDFDFSHLNYKEARKRVERIDKLIAGLQAARLDLEPRSHKAKLSF